MAFDFSAVVAPFRMRPGLQRLAPGAPQLTPIRPGDRAYREKLAVLSSFAGEALVAVPRFDAAQVLSTVADQSASERHGAFLQHGKASFSAPRLGWAVRDGRPEGDGPREVGACLSALPDAVRSAALLSLAFAEDFAVLDGATGCVPWLAVCLPSTWAPEEKVGRHFTHIHAPVADNDALLAASTALVDLVTQGDRWERYVWTLTDDPRLHRHPRRAPPTHWNSASTPDELAASTFFRSERQTFMPVTGMRQAVFTIHVEVRPLRDVVGSPAAAQRLHAALSSMSAAVLAYRGLGDARDRLLAWLDAVAAPR
ncbi:MAG: heme-dependent oxidative N-demethylase subunit alpha family protein [Caldimonas sp.]